MFNKQKYFFRNFLVFCIPILLTGSLILANNLWHSYQETDSLKNSALLQMIEEMDALNTQMQAVADKVGTNAEFTKAECGNEEEYACVTQWLSLYKNLFVDEITLAYYIPGDSNIILHDAAMPYRDFERNYASAADFSLAGYYKTLNQSWRPVASNLSHTEGSFYAFSNIYPITDQEAKHVGTLCFLVPRAVLQATFSRYFSQESAKLYILDAANQPVFYEQKGTDKVRELSCKSSIGLVKNQRGEIILHGVSQQSRYSYFVIMPKSDFYASSNFDMSFLYAFEAVLLLFSATIAVALTRSYCTNLQQMRGQNQKLEYALEEGRDAIHTLVLQKLIDGSHKDKETADYNLHCANIQFCHSFFFVLVTDFTDAAEEDAAIADFYSLFGEMDIGKLQTQILSRTEIHQMVVIINSSCNQQELVCVLTNLIAQKAWRLPMGLSKMHSDYLHLNNAYIEAVVAINEQLDMVVDGFFLFNDEKQTACASLVQPLEDSVMQECIRNGNRELLAERIAVLFQRISVSCHLPQITDLACYDAINLCVRLYAFFEVPLNTQTILAVSDFESLEVLADQMKILLFKLCDVVQERIDNAEISTKYNLIGFVQENFRNNNLSLSFLADEFGLSQSYVSKLFKEETGQNFISYVKQLRMFYVKKQLAETELQVKDIIHDAGYTDVANFTRIFKQDVGVTPLQYRRNIRRC